MRVGWRQRLEQAYRFELALEVVAQSAADATVLDVGCGLGALAQYARESGVQRRFVGIEPRADFAAFARATEQYDAIFESSFEDVEIPDVEVAVAIGVLTGDSAVSLRTLWTFVRQAPRWAFTVLNREALLERPVLAVEHLRGTYSLEEVESCCEEATIVEVTPTDFAVVSTPDELQPCSVETRYEATLAGPWGGAPASEKAWLACELGLIAEAEHWLDHCERGGLADVVRERLRLSRTRGAAETP